MKRLSAIDIAVCTAVMALVAFTLVPAIARIQRHPAEAKCQSNLQRVADAMALYLEDNHHRYPTNRGRGSGTTDLGPIVPILRLSPDPAVSRFVYGLNWVEALYPYTKARADRTGQNEASFWRCPNASSETFPTSATDLGQRVTCVFNFCLAEQPSGLVRNSRNLLMLREIGRLGLSMLRPSNTANISPNGNRAYQPLYPFLTQDEALARDPLPASEYLLHANGSYVVFADGHVKHFTIDYYPAQNYITAARCWDPTKQQWYNYYWANPVTEDQKRKNKTIAISL